MVSGVSTFRGIRPLSSCMCQRPRSDPREVPHFDVAGGQHAPRTCLTPGLLFRLPYGPVRISSRSKEVSLELPSTCFTITATVFNPLTKAETGRLASTRALSPEFAVA
jgi:hypothetical protein